MASIPKNIVSKPKAVKSCKHDINLQNIGAVTTATAIRVTTITPATQIVASTVPAGWHQIANYPTQVVWQPSAGGILPTGNLPAGFSVSIQNDAKKDKRVLIEWMSKEKILCRQTLRVGCGVYADFIPKKNTLPKGLATMEPREGNPCRCFSAETAEDENSNEVAEPDISVELGAPVLAGFLKVAVPYTVELEPANLQVTRNWEVTIMDEMEEEQIITLPFVDNLTGQAVFTLPHAGEYNFTLTVTDNASCASSIYKKEEADELSDFDYATFKTTSTTSSIIAKQIDICDPTKFKLIDITEPVGFNQKWTIKQGSTVILDFPTMPSNSNVIVDLPLINNTYTVILNADELDIDNNLVPRIEANITISTQPNASTIEFDHDTFNSCVEDGFVVQFVNKSNMKSCNYDWIWDFGDGTTFNGYTPPSHTFTNGTANPSGTYTVTLTMIDSAGVQTSATKVFTFLHWKPDINITVCADGHVIFETFSSYKHKENTLHDDLTWSHQGGIPPFPIFYSHKKKLRVCYNGTGQYTVSLEGTNSDGGHCQNKKNFSINSITRVCPRDKVKEDKYFSYKSKNYRLRTKFKFRGNLLGRIFAKSKLQIQKPIGIWARKKAHNISVSFTGDVITKSGNCYNSNSYSVSGNKNKSKRAKVSKWLMPGVGTFRVQKDGLISNHSVQVDASHSGESQTNSLWINECKCGLFS